MQFGDPFNQRLIETGHAQLVHALGDFQSVLASLPSHLGHDAAIDAVAGN